MRLLLLLLLLTPTAYSLPPTYSPALTQLQTAITQAETNLQALTTTIAQQRAHHQTELRNLNRTTFTLLRLANWPSPLLHANSLLGQSLPAATLLNTTRTHVAAAHATTTAKLANYLALRTQAETQLAQLNNLQATFATQRKRLTAQQQQTLRLAALDATSLANHISTPPISSNLAPSILEPSTLLPVQGQKAPAGEGATFYLTQANAPVVAVVEGKVAYAGPFQNLGGLVITEGPDNVYAVYGGLGTLMVNEGQTVTIATPLGTMPASNHARLYFEIRRNGKPLALESLRK